MKNLVNWVSFACVPVVYITLFIVSLGRFGNFSALADIVSHFYLQMFAVLFLIALFYWYGRLRRELAISILLLLFLGYSMAGADFSGIYSGSEKKNPDILYMNTEFLNTDIQPIMEYVKTVSPKQVAMVELNKELFDKVGKELGYSYRYYYPDMVFSFGFFTNEEVIEQHTYFSEWYPIGYFRTKEHAYYVVHPLPPIGAERYEGQKRFFAYLRSLLDSEEHFVLVGDFNSSPYSRVFQKYFGDFFYKTVYSWGTNTILTIPIDHAIARTKLDISPGPKLSSDHNPLLISF